MDKNVERLRERIRRSAAICNKALKDATMREDRSRGHVGHIERLTGDRLPPDTHTDN